MLVDCRSNKLLYDRLNLIVRRYPQRAEEVVFEPMGGVIIHLVFLGVCQSQ